MASRNYTQSNNTNCFYTQYLPDYQLPAPTEFINLENIVFSEQIESNFQKASKKIGKSGQEDSKKVMRKKHNRARNPWTPQEDLKLVELMKKHGQSWAMISAQMEGRSGKQIRDRFLNKLRPGLKLGDWTPAEDDLMIKLLNEIGNRWSLIATHLPGRTEGQVKNRYYSSIKKRLETSGAAFSQTSAASTLSETVSSFPTSPQAEEPKFDFGFDFDANMMNSFNQEPIVNSINNQPTYMVNKGAYVFEEETFSENITQSPVSQNDPASMVSYELGQQSDFFLPTIENDNQVDDMLDKVTNYFLGNSSPASDVDSYFSDDLKCQQKSALLAQEADTNEKMALLARRKAYLELALAKTLKEMKSF